MYNMMGWDGGYWRGYGLAGGGAGLITTLLVWTILVLVIALLWKHLNKK
ncbi:MAG: hypothetical protein HYY86_00170 [Candidatus Harrisonbacteria bacterium]|nr:hypothetical protein [Candidatus Harrisonbacteria bacterium]